MEFILWLVTILFASAALILYFADNDEEKSIKCMISAIGIAMMALLFTYGLEKTITSEKIITNYVNQKILDEPVTILKVTTYKFFGSMGNVTKFYLVKDGLTFEVSIDHEALF